VAGAVRVREFDVLINGNIVLKRFDIFASASGKLKGVDRSFETIFRGGGRVIEFRPVKGNALVSALSITSLDQH
jgi:beta-galactosidase